VIIIKLTKINLESIFLLIVFSVMLWAGCAIFFNHELSHNFPFGYLASDTYQHQVRVESIKLMGNYRYEAPYIVAGYEDNVGFYQPLLYHIGAIFSYVSGLETYDSTYLLIFILTSFASLIMYLIIRQFNKHVAILSLPLSLLVFSQAPYIGFTWGHWPAVSAQFFLIAFFWALSKINLKNSFILFTIFLSATILTHTSEAVFAAMFLFIYFIYKFIKKDYKTLFKQALIGSILSFIICFYYLVIFKFTWARMQPYSFYAMKAWASPMFGIPSFKYLLIFLSIGFIISLFYFRKKKSTAFLVGLVMLLIGYSNYYGFGHRSFQARFFWPIYLSIFLGAGIYYLIKLIIKKLQTIHSIAIASIFLIILNISAMSSIVPVTARFTAQGLMSQQHWDMFRWFQDNVNNEKILFFYGDFYGQKAILRNTHIPPYRVGTNYFTSILQNKTIKREYMISRLGDHHGVHYAYRKSFFEYGYHAEEEESKDPTYYYSKMRDICTFDYYIFDKVSQQPVFAQYNMLIASELIKKEWIQPVYGNDYVIVLKNNNPGEDCINEKRFD